MVDPSVGRSVGWFVLAVSVGRAGASGGACVFGNVVMIRVLRFASKSQPMIIKLIWFILGNFQR